MSEQTYIEKNYLVFKKYVVMLSLSLGLKEKQKSKPTAVP